MSNPSATQPRTTAVPQEQAHRPIDIRCPRAFVHDEDATIVNNQHASSAPQHSHSIPTLSSSNPAGLRTNVITPPSPQYLGADEPNSLPSPAPVTPLRLTTDAIGLSRHGSNRSANARAAAAAALKRQNSNTNLQPLSRTPSLKTALANSIGNSIGNRSAASSVVASPIISAMGDMTPLPSPLLSGDSPGPWRRRMSSAPSSPPQMRDRLRSVAESSVLVTSTGESIDAAMTHAPKRKMYASLEKQEPPAAAIPPSGSNHRRNRSASEYVPDPSVSKRPIAVSGSHINIDARDSGEPQIKRELNLAESRGLTPTTAKPPTPPPSEPSGDKRRLSAEIFEARGRHDQVRRRWKSVRSLGQGTFSRVVLATSQVSEPGADSDADASRTPDRKTLVAIKICEHGPRGGASEERVEMSLKRELEIMQIIHHPSLVDLKAWDIEPSRAILVLGYCAGGDLFDVATGQRSMLKAPLLRRMFAELIGAVTYLHRQQIVHRDIKLENVLVNLTPEELGDSATDWTTYPYSVITLTDLGLSRRITNDEQLETRCGSDDYAAPEVIMGQPYDGRATDAWSIGVLLYALLEARLPFDPHPGMSDAHRMRSRTSHRIARVEWRWIEYAGDDGDHDGDEAKFEREGLLGAMHITEGLLKRARSRWSVDKVSQQQWVKDAMMIEGGLRFREEQAGEEVS